MTDSEYIQKLIDSSDTAVVPRLNPMTGAEVWDIDRALELDSGKTLILDGCTLRLRDGVFSNIITTRGAWEKNPKPVSGIRIIGKNGAALDGGLHNGLTERTQLKDGYPEVLRNTLILLRSASGFEVSGLKLTRLRYWGMTYYFCAGGRISDIVFEAANNAPNQDGIDLRLGCRDISIDDVSGTTGDDTIALTALYGKFDRRFYPGESPETPDESCDIRGVSVTNVSAECTGGHGLIRLLCQDGVKLYRVSIDGVYDRALDHGGVRCIAAIRLGDSNYSTIRRANIGEMRDITVENVETAAKQAILQKLEIPGGVFRNIREAEIE